MSIALSCPECEASFKVKDEFAGKKARCPKCKTIIPIPAAEEEEEEEVKPRRAAARKPVADDDEDDAPRKSSRRRARDDDDEEDEADRPRSKKLLWIAGGGGLAVILGLVLFFVLKPKSKQDGGGDNQGSINRNNPKVVSATLQSIKPNMKLSEVEANLGKGDPTTFDDALGFLDSIGGSGSGPVSFHMPGSGAKKWYVWYNGEARIYVGVGDTVANEPVAISFYGEKAAKGGYKFFMGEYAKEDVNQLAYQKEMNDPRWLTGTAFQQGLIGEWKSGNETYDYREKGMVKYTAPNNSFSLRYTFKDDRHIDIEMVGRGKQVKVHRVMVDQTTLNLAEMQGGKVVKWWGPYQKAN